MGDAAHAIVPFYCQGMNAGFEDCRFLNMLLDQFNGDFEKIMPEYTRLRKPAGDVILQLALNNYIEMRDKTADKDFLLKRKLNAASVRSILNCGSRSKSRFHFRTRLIRKLLAMAIANSALWIKSCRCKTSTIGGTHWR